MSTNVIKCLICGSKCNKVFEHMILGKYQISFFQCPKCCFLQTEKPFWLDEAYKSAISDLDILTIERNINNTIIFHQIAKKLFKKNSIFLDYGAGYGIFCRLMRNLGSNFLWYDKNANNIFAKYFEYSEQKVDAITCFEVFEHFEDPMQEIEKLFAISSNIFFTTRIYDKHDKLPNKNWSYYNFDAGQHISFYSEETLKYIAKHFKVELISINNCWHVFTKNKKFKEKLSFLNDISKEFNQYVREVILNCEKKYIIDDINYIKEHR